MHRQVVRTGLAYGRRQDLDDPEGERDFRDFVQHCSQAPVPSLVQVLSPPNVTMSLQMPARRTCPAAIQRLNQLRLVARGQNIGSSQSKGREPTEPRGVGLTLVDLARKRVLAGQ